MAIAWQKKEQHNLRLYIFDLPMYLQGRRSIEALRREPRRGPRVRAPTPVALAVPALTALALAGALSGCQSTQEQSAKLEAKAKLEKREHPANAQHGLSIAHPSTRVRVLEAAVPHSSEGAAAAVTVENTSAQTLEAVPIAIAVKGASGKVVYQNNTAGLEPSLTQISSLPAHGSLTWVDDQVPSTGEPASVTATVGEAPAANRPQPRIEVSGLHLAEASTGETAGKVHNGSTVSQRHLVVYVTAVRSDRVVAAGRAVLAELAAGATMPFQVFLIGSPSGARLQASAPAVTAG